jgi:hypothetical protein
VEEMHEGALTLNKEGLVLYCNNRLAELVKEPADHVIGSYFKRFLTPADVLHLDNLLAQPAETKNDKMTVSLINSLYLKLSFRLGPPYSQGENYIVIATDISELKKKENELLEIHRLLKQHLDLSQGLRIDLVNAKLEANTENNKLKKENKKLVDEISRLKLDKQK